MLKESDQVSASDSMEAAPRKGIILIVAAMLAIPLVDGIAKYLSSDFSPFFISWARYAVASFFVIPFAFFTHGFSILPKERLSAHFLRTIFLVSAMALYFYSISLIPLATAISAYFIGPIVTVVLGVIFLGEIVTFQKVISLILGFVGSLIILQPGSDWEPGIIMAFGSGFLFAMYMVTSRMTSLQSDPIKTLVIQCLLGTLMLTPTAFISWSWPSIDFFWLFAGLGIFSAIGHILTIFAFRYANSSTLAPLSYFELLVTALIGYTIFSEIPDYSTVIGSFCIIVAGLFLYRSSRS